MSGVETAQDSPTRGLTIRKRIHVAIVITAALGCVHAFAQDSARNSAHATESLAVAARSAGNDAPQASDAGLNQRDLRGVKTVNDPNGTQAPMSAVPAAGSPSSSNTNLTRCIAGGDCNLVNPDMAHHTGQDTREAAGKPVKQQGSSGGAALAAAAAAAIAWRDHPHAAGGSTNATPGKCSQGNDYAITTKGTGCQAGRSNAQQ